MKQYSISITKGDGNIGHNSNVNRREKLENVDSDRIKDNQTLVHIGIKKAYHDLFDESVDKYNATQKRADRRITDYYKKISKSKKEKPFYEFVVQVGNMDSHPDIETTNKIYKEFVNVIQEKYPQIFVFGAYIHNDEATPHLHLDFIPYAYYDKGQNKRVSLSKAMAQMGYSFAGNDERDKGLYKAWRNDLMNDFEIVCKRANICRLDMHNTEKHEANVQKFKECENLKKEINQLSTKKQTISNSIEKKTEYLDVIEHSIEQKEIKLSGLESNLMDNPIKTFTKDTEIISTIKDIKDELNNQHIAKQSNVDKFRINQSIPSFNSNWLERNVEYVEPRKDLFGKPKEPAYVKINIKEWQNKQKNYKQNQSVYKALSDMYFSLVSKHKALIKSYNNLYNKAVHSLCFIENGIRSIKNLPSFARWNDIKNTKNENKRLHDELEHTIKHKNSVIKNLQNTIEALQQEATKGTWYQEFYNHILPILHRSKNEHGHSSFEEAIEVYDDDTQFVIKQDLDRLSVPEYKKIVYINGEYGYGWYSSKEEGHIYLGKKSDTEKLMEIYHNAKFSDPYDHVFNQDKGWER